MNLEGDTQTGVKGVGMNLDPHDHPIHTTYCRTQVMMAKEGVFGGWDAYLKAALAQQELCTDGLLRWHEQIQVDHRAQPRIRVHTVNEKWPFEDRRHDLSVLQRFEHFAQDTQADLVRSPMMSVLRPQLTCHWSREVAARREMTVQKRAESVFLRKGQQPDPVLDSRRAGSDLISRVRR